MADPFVAEIRILACTFAPRGWAFCQGQLLPISQNTALFSLVGTYYGGDGRSSFGLPNLQGRGVVGPGQGPGLSDYAIGEQTGTDSVTLLSSEMPAHRHNINVSNADGTAAEPNGNLLARDLGGANEYSNAASGIMNTASVGSAGGSQPHTNMQPYQVLNYCIALSGVFPARS